MATHAPAPSGGGKGGLKTVMGTIVLLIIVLFAISKCGGGKGNGTANTPQGPAAVQTGPVQQPAQAAPVATDPCAGNPAVTVTARPAGTTPEWVSIPMGHCEAVPQTPGMGISYTRVCLNTKRETDTTGLCPDGAYAVGYQSTSSRTIQVTTRFRYNP